MWGINADYEQCQVCYVYRMTLFKYKAICSSQMFLVVWIAPLKFPNMVLEKWVYSIWSKSFLEQGLCY